MDFDHFVDIVLNATGYSSPYLASGAEREARMRDHNYTSLTSPCHHNYTSLTSPCHHSYTSLTSPCHHSNRASNRNFKETYENHNNNTDDSNNRRETNNGNAEWWSRVERLPGDDDDDDDDDDDHVISVSDDRVQRRKVTRGDEVRKLHNSLEKRRRARQRGLLDSLRGCLPGNRGVRRRWSQHSVINSAITHILTLSREELMIKKEVLRLHMVESQMIDKLSQLRVPPRSASHLSNDSGADSGIINSDDEEVDVA